MTYHRGLESPGRSYLNGHEASAEWWSRDRTTHLDNEYSLENLARQSSALWRGCGSEGISMWFQQSLP